MANPRQRSKKGSRPVRTTRKNNLKKVTIKGPKALVDSWDKTKTPLQNYKRLGLMSSLAPHLAGGIEKDISPRYNAMDEDVVEPAQPDASSSKIPKGYGRIVRDAEGNVTGIEMGDPEEEEVLEGANAMDVAPPALAAKGKGRAMVLTAASGEGTDVVKALQALSDAAPPRPKRTVTSAESDWLRSMHAVHGENTDAMARDIKLNRLQKTRGEIEKSLKRAGGWAKVL